MAAIFFPAPITDKFTICIANGTVTSRIAFCKTAARASAMFGQSTGGFSPGMAKLRNGPGRYGLIPVVTHGAHIALFTGGYTGGGVCDDPLARMCCHRNALGFRCRAIGTFAFPKTSSNTGGFVFCIPTVPIVVVRLLRNNFRLFPVIAVGAHVSLFTGLCTGGAVGGDPLVGMGLQGNALGFLVGAVGALALFLAGINTS